MALAQLLPPGTAGYDVGRRIGMETQGQQIRSLAALAEMIQGQQALGLKREQIAGAREDRAAQRDLTQELGLGRIEQSAKAAEMLHQYRLQGMQRQSDRDAERARHSKVMETLAAQANAIRASKQPREQFLNTEKGIFKVKGDGTYEPVLDPATGKPMLPANQFKAALEAQTKDQAKKSVSEQLTLMSNYYDELNKSGAIVSSDRGALSNIGASVAASAPGQIAGRVVGTETQATRDKINQMRPLLLTAIKQATGMSGTQLNSNVELQFYLQAATDPSRDISTNKAALHWLDKQFGLGTGVESDPKAAEALAKQVPGAQQGDQFEVGKTYTDKNGNKAKYLGNGKWQEM